MFDRRFLMHLVVCLVVMNIRAYADNSTIQTAPEAVPGFELLDGAGQRVVVEAQSTPQWTVVCFLGTECPMARQYGPRLNTLAN